MESSRQKRILAIDIGGGTQDILVYESWKNPENLIKLVLPSPTVIIGQRIRQAAEKKLPLYLTGTVMGGGKTTRAIKEHLGKGLPVYAAPGAAKTVFDDLRKVEELGIILTEAPPEEPFFQAEMKDLNLGALERAFHFYDIELPRDVAVAVQDHGEAPPGVSNRLFRFNHWDTFLQEGGMLEQLAYFTPPDYLTRMKAVQQEKPGAMVMDTCAAAIQGALLDPAVKQELFRGVVVVNIGNQHTFAALIKEQRIFGLFEHHTHLMTGEKLFKMVNKLRNGELDHEEVFADGGHGCSMAADRTGTFKFVSVTGPRRCIAADLNYHSANPFGDMMMTGCYGLVKAFQEFHK